VSQPTLSIDCAARITFASAQNAVPMLRAIEIHHDGDAPLHDLTLALQARPPFCRAKRWHIDHIPPGGKLSVGDRELTLDLDFLARLNEAEQGQLICTLNRDEAAIAEQVVPVEILARDQWGGLGDMAQLLAAFVLPNDPAVAPLLKTASRLLEQAGHSGALDGYQTGDPARAYMLTAAIWSAVTGLGLTYAEPPASFERTGQKVRDPGRIADEGLATCLDSALLFAAAIEAAGLHPVVIFTAGHAFAGVWLVNRTFTSVTEPDITELRKAIAGHELLVFETTLATQRPVAGFEQAVERGKIQLDEAREASFDQAIDISRARAARIRPLASHRERQAQAIAATAEVAPATLPQAPDFGLLPGEQTEELPATPQGRIERWQRKLLDLSLRNRLLNFADTKQTVPFVCPDVPRLEDLLAAGKKLRIISLPDENPIGQRDAELHREQTGEDITRAFALAALDRGEVCVSLGGRDMAARLTTLFRKAKSDLAEGGTNTLFLAAGFLRWKKRAEDERVYRAPLLLLPVKLERRSSQSVFFLSHHEDDVRINATLLQFLERDFGLRIPLQDGELPTDDHGIDLPRTFAMLRHAVRDVPGFEVVEELALSTFSFAKYLMWKDLVDRTDSLRQNRLVRHLIDSPETPFAVGNGDFPEPKDIDRRHSPAELVTPLPADSSQLAAVVAASQGHDFVVIGPPGTGKSQTIANMIAHCLAHGKSVLFVAEKSAALDVVYRRLRHYGLADACLELHSSKADRRSVIRQLGDAWDRAAEDARQEWVRITDQLEVHRNQLMAYVEALHAPGTQGFSVFEAIGQVVGKKPACELRFASHDAHDADSFRALEALAAAAGRTYPVIAECHGLDFVTRDDWSFGWQTELASRVGALQAAAQALAAAAEALARTLGLPPDQAYPRQRLHALSRFTAIAEKTAGQEFHIALQPSVSELRTGFETLASNLDALHQHRRQLAADYPDAEIPRIPVDTLEQDWREAGTRFWPFSTMRRRRVRKLLQTYASAGTANPATDLAPLRSIQAAVGAIAASPLAALPVFNGPNTDIGNLRGYLADVGELRAAISGLLALNPNRATLKATLASLLTPSGDASPANPALRDFAAATIRFDAARDTLAEHTGGTPADDSLHALQQALDTLREQQHRLQDWTKWSAVRRQAIERGLEPLITALEDGRISEAAAAFRTAYLHWWLPLALDASPVLRGFAHWEHEDRIARFRALDDAMQRLASAQVRHAVAHDLPPRDGVARRSELGTLRHQLGLQRPSISIRRLIAEMPESFTQLTPCVLMSPLSVAQYLPPDHAQFDMIVFDEASQITTWDAVGAIARGTQSIIVGDPKQLPPTNFFGRSNDDEDAELEVFEKDLPSILDEAAAAGLRTHQLDWHYRSRDEALIAFSNHHYYGNRLITFPSPSTGADALVRHRVDGVYARGSGRTNAVEARAVVDLVQQRLTAWLSLPETERPTLGVITFNAQQQELILDLLDAARRDTPALDWFFDDEREEPVIVKNLENIQGDERDVMLFSITFGPDQAGKMTMNFGAVNGNGGERRLNVAITRARAELHVVTSFDADQIDLTRTKALGVAHLKGFLDYAARGPIALPAMDRGSVGPAESPFEEAVADALRQRGWEVRTQIGVSGFRIDLGIVHPDRAGAYLAGIECDGATYHSAASVRDRDRIREEVLRNLGWEILRIWSTDWFRQPVDARERVDGRLRELLHATRARLEAERQAAKAASGLDQADAAAAPAGDELAPGTATGTATSAADRALAEAPTDSTPPAPGEEPPQPGAHEDRRRPAGHWDRRRLAGHRERRRPAGESDRPPDEEATSDPAAISSPAEALIARNTGDTVAPSPAHTSHQNAGTTNQHAYTTPPLPRPDPDRFYAPDYTPTLEQIIAGVVQRDGPIRDDLLARVVCREHGWQRAGRRIRERILDCLGDNAVHTDGDRAFIWAPGTYAPRIAFRHELERGVWEVPSEEMLGLIAAHPELAAAEDAARELARLMGIARVSEEARAFLEACLARFSTEFGPGDTPAP
jgi:very-short-patch-repair endonuclease